MDQIVNNRAVSVSKEREDKVARTVLILMAVKKTTLPIMKFMAPVAAGSLLTYNSLSKSAGFENSKDMFTSIINGTPLPEGVMLAASTLLAYQVAMSIVSSSAWMMAWIQRHTKLMTPWLTN